MDNDLEQLKTDQGVIRLYAQYAKLKKEGDRYSGCCPIHKERNPSFSVFKDMMWSCFSGCGNGNIFQFVQKMDGCDFKTAASKVREFLGGSTWEAQKSRWSRRSKASLTLLRHSRPSPLHNTENIRITSKPPNPHKTG